MIKRGSVLLLLIASVLAFSSCTKDHYYTEYVTELPDGNFAEVVTKYVTVDANDWRWDNSFGRYKASVSFPELEQGVYDDGFAVGNIFVFENGKEVLYTLPYVKTYVKPDNTTFTETISCSLSADRKTVDFYIESTEKYEDNDALNTYDFKVGMVLNFTFTNTK